ncbi:MAG: deoxyribodipyrimidine photo-lyase [Alphaproteobacteria bacterium]|nr:deoxyribodipyrimidine photo-lyase [Alphaproteobacteria bacterium]
MTTLVWFRQDLRVTDNPALTAAARGAVLPVFILDDTLPWAPGAASRWWLHESLSSLGSELSRLGASLVLRRGPALTVLKSLVAEAGITRVVWNRLYEPAAAARGAEVKAALTARGIAVESYNASCLAEPWHLPRPYQVFAPFWRALQERGEPSQPLPPPLRLVPAAAAARSETLSDWKLQPNKPDWAEGLRATWTPGEAGAAARIDAFCEVAPGYGRARDFPGEEGTSRLSPHLHFGEVSPRQVWHAIRARVPDADIYLRELAWREFSIHLLHQSPTLPEEPLRSAFADFPWRRDPAQLRAWRHGRTGYPIVDAGMRQLWRTGWMHNRVRMIVASFLVKHLLLPWQEGEAWFWDTLVDADLANNAANWQWVAGCGADAATYFRIFNPVLQGEKFDPAGAYVRRWVPEIARLPNAVLHKPWQASAASLDEAGIRLGDTYPRPIVDHAAARARALAAFNGIRAKAA